MAAQQPSPSTATTEKREFPIGTATLTAGGRGITLRAILIAIVCIIIGAFWGVYGDVVSQTDLTSTSLMMPPIVLLTALVAGNSLLRRWRPRWALTQSELMVIYVMMTVSIVITGMGQAQFLFTTLGAVPHFATPENKWERFLQHVPKWLLPNPTTVFKGFYEGNSAIPLRAWTIPLMVWGGFLFVLLFAMLCINSIVRKQWVDRERLSFPITYLPIEMVRDDAGFFRNRLMWIGFAIPVVLESMNSLNFLYPSIPYIQLRAYNLNQYFVDKPWNAIGYFTTTFYPLTIGLAFLLSTEVSFSCWFFYLVAKAENIFSASVGLRDPNTPANMARFPFIGEQATGAFIGLAIMLVWIGRKHLKEVLRKAFTRAPDVDDSKEPLPYRWAVAGLIVSALLLTAFCIAAGMSPVVGLLYLGIYLIYSITITRMRAEAGTPWTMGPGWDARNAIVNPVGSSAFSARNLTMLAYLNWFSIELRCDPMPTHLEGFRMNEAARVRQRWAMLVMIGAIALGIVVAFWMCLAVWYKFGAGTARVEQWRTNMGKLAFDRLDNALNNQTQADYTGISAVTFGALFCAFLVIMRSRFVWFPFHPVGYVVGFTGTMDWLWCPFLVAWLIKVLLIRYGGIKAYRRALPFFLGLVLGDYIISSFWALLGSVLGLQMYRCFPC